ncbi:hypothetical protein X963_5043 [Burkholderia pseudomallei MSHR7498]|nr:hypothetical protein X963_5043 [Burkholderia pseudomallei MSHR7498]
MRTVQLLPTYSVDKTSVTIRPGMCSDRTHQTRHRTDRAAAEHHDRQCTQHHRQLSHFFSFPFIQRVCLLIKISTDAILSLTTNLPTGYVQLLIDLLLLPSV